MVVVNFAENLSHKFEGNGWSWTNHQDTLKVFRNGMIKAEFRPGAWNYVVSYENNDEPGTTVSSSHNSTVHYNPETQYKKEKA